MTDIIDSGEIPPRFEQRTSFVGENTEWLNPYLATMAWPVLRRQIDTTAEIRMPQTIGIHGPYRQGGVIYGPRPTDAWIGDLLQEPPTGPVPPLPKPPRPAAPGKAVRRVRFRHRRRLAPVVKAVLATAAVGTAMWAGLFVAALAVIR